MPKGGGKVGRSNTHFKVRLGLGQLGSNQVQTWVDGRRPEAAAAAVGGQARVAHLVQLDGWPPTGSGGDRRRRSPAKPQGALMADSGRQHLSPSNLDQTPLLGARELPKVMAGGVGQRRCRAAKLSCGEDNPTARARPQDFDPQPIALKLRGGFPGDQQRISKVADLSFDGRKELGNRSGWI